MGIHRGVTFTAHLDTELSVTAERIQHVVEKRHTCSYRHGAAIEIDNRVDPGLESRSGDVRPPLAGPRFGRGHAAGSSVAKIALSCSAKNALSSGVPIETLRQSAMPYVGLPKWRT